MKEFKDKVAIITGAASGIGRAMADRSVQEGMKAVLADVELETLTKSETSLKAAGVTVLAARADGGDVLPASAGHGAALPQSPCAQYSHLPMLTRSSTK